tara:strand:- start:95 stop:2269 length:2175 start_codon:yes stop_codon:yes gene_type:complete
MGLFDEWKNKTDADKLQQKYLTDFQKGKVNKANELAEGIMQSVLELGTMSGLTKQETLDKFNAQLAKQPDRLSYDNKVIGAAGEIVGELIIAAPASTMGWFGAGGKVAQILKQGLFGGLWEGLTKPVKEGESRQEAATQAGLISGGATAVLGVVGRPIEKVTNFDFKSNIQAVKDASASLGISPKLLGDFTGDDATRAAEAMNRLRAGGVSDRLKQNAKELQKAGGTVETTITGGAQYSGKAGENIAKAVEANYTNATKEGNKLYKKLDVLASQNDLSKIRPSETELAVNNVISEYGDLFKALERPSLEAKLTSFGSKLGKEEVKQEAGLIVSESGRPFIPEIKGPTDFTFSDIRKAREGLTDALSAAKAQNKFGPKEAVRLNEVIDAMDRDIENWGKTLTQNQSVSNAFTTARSFWKGNVIPLRDADLAMTMIKDPNSGELKTDISKLVNKIVSAESTGQEGAKRASMMIAKVLPPDIKQDVAAATFDTARKEATDVGTGTFDPIKFSTFLQSRKTNLQPFVDENLDTLLNKYSFLTSSMTRQAAGSGLDEAMTQGLRVGVGAAVGGAPGAAIAAVPVNRAIEALSRSVFDTKAGRAMMLSATSLDDLRPLITGGVVSAPSEQTVEQQPPEAPAQWSMPPEFGGQPSETPKYEMPPELTAPPAQPTTTIDQQRQAIFNAELKTEMDRSMAAQEKGDEEGTNRAVRSLNSLLMEAARAKIPLSY